MVMSRKLTLCLIIALTIFAFARSSEARAISNDFALLQPNTLKIVDLYEYKNVIRGDIVACDPWGGLHRILIDVKKRSFLITVISLYTAYDNSTILSLTFYPSIDELNELLGRPLTTALCVIVTMCYARLQR